MSAVLNLQATERLNPKLNAADSFKKFDLRDDLTNQPKLANENWQKELNDKIKASKMFNDALSAARPISTKLNPPEPKKEPPKKLSKDQLKDLTKQSADLGSQIDRNSEALKRQAQQRMFKSRIFILGGKEIFLLPAS